MTRAPVAVMAGLCCFFCGSRAVFADGGETSAAFLSIDKSPRSAAMGGASCALAEGVEGMEHNPAGLVYGGAEVMLSHLEWFAGLKNDYAAATLPLSSSLAVGVSGNYFHSSPIASYDSRGGQLSDVKPWEGAAALGLGIELEKGCAVGFTGKYITQSMGGAKAAAYAADVGLYQKLEHWSGGAVVENVGTQLQLASVPFDLPLVYKLGFAWLPDTRLALSAQAAKPQSDKLQFSSGVEYKLPLSAYAASFRAGYRYLPDEGTGDGFCYGFGFDFGSLRVDYAYVPYGNLGATHRMALVIKFSERKKPPRSKKAKQRTLEGFSPA